MSQQELVRRMVKAFEAEGIPYMLTGSQASSLQGEPRSTHDVDVVINLSLAKMPVLKNWFPEPDYYFDEDSARDAVEKRHTFNILETGTGDKIDLWMLRDDDYDRMRFSRRMEVEALGIKIKVSRPEDTILFKLSWALKSGGSEKQARDAISIFEVYGDALDKPYMDEWAKFLKVVDLLERVRREAKPLDE
jgi:hypothetical protein